MSMASRPTTKAEHALLTAHGFSESPLECIGDFTTVDGETLYCGNWYHAERPLEQGHMGPDEALEFLKARLQEFAKITPE